VVIAVFGLATVASIGLVACGSSGGSSSEGKEGGTLNATFAGFPDYLDPALSYTAEGWTALGETYLPLLTFAHAGGAAGGQVIPALAKEMPKITNGGKTYTLFLRPGLKYSNGESVKASDFTYAVERAFRVNSGGSPFYAGIVGAEKFAETKSGGIPGIKTNDKTGEIVINLTKPRGTFTNELALMFVAPVPQGTPNSDQSTTPIPATGPYMITKANRSSGWSYVRNPYWAKANSKAMPELPSGHVDRIAITIIKNPSTQVNDVEQGRFEWMQNPPPPDRLPELRRKYEGTQFREEPTISTFYFWMNTTKPPFDDPRVRRAVNYAVNPAALERIYAGTMRATQQILPPGMPGYEKYEPYPYDPGRARELIAAADPSDRAITVWTNSFHPNDEAGEYYGDVLSKLGFDVKLKIIGVANYFTVIGNRLTPDLDTGWANWLEDYPHPDDYFRPQLSGESIAASGNTNWALIDEPGLNAEIARLGREPLGPKQEAEYAALDKSFMRRAPWAPFGTLTLSTFVSSAIDLDKVIYSPISGQDLTSFQFK
jgi:peptide/nickel transport system substrate-binding protein